MARRKQKWFLPFQRSKVNYEDVGLYPYLLQHDVGFSGRKLYRPVKHTPGIAGIGAGFILKGHSTPSRREALKELRELTGETRKNFVMRYYGRKQPDGSVRIFDRVTGQQVTTTKTLSAALQKLASMNAKASPADFLKKNPAWIPAKAIRVLYDTAGRATAVQFRR